jgi:hypothetical protein
MYNVHVVTLVTCAISIAAGTAAGAASVRYFRSRTSAPSVLTFWPAFWLVGFLAFVVTLTLTIVIFGPIPQR